MTQRWILPGVLAVALAGCDTHEGHDHSHSDDANKVVDPICGMKVSKEVTYRSNHDGKQFFFCNPYCKESFDKEPAKFAMGYCGCAKKMKNCDCGHCAAIAEGKPPAEPCPCGKEDHGHDH
jgi:YHS domain-containing protein